MTPFLNWKKPLFLAFLLSMKAFFPAFAQAASGGRGGFELLKISPVSRATGIGDAYTALGDDVGALFYNPAGLAGLLTNEMNLTYLSLYQSISFESVGLAFPLSHSVGTLALGVNLLQPGNMQRLSDFGTPLGTFSSADEVVSMAFARKFGPNVYLGVTGKFVQQEIDTVQTSAFDVDAGILVLPPLKGMRFGISLRNLGAQSEPLTLPLSMSTGVSYREYGLFSPKDDAAFSAEAFFPLRPVEDKVGVRAGIEYNFKWIGNRATLRGGYKFLDRDLGEEGASIGAGYGVDLGGAGMFLDYAFAPADVFGAVHRLSLTSKF